MLGAGFDLLAEFPIVAKKWDALLAVDAIRVVLEQNGGIVQQLSNTVK